MASEKEIENLKSELSEIKNIAEKDNTTELKSKLIELETSVKSLKEDKKNVVMKKKSLFELIKEKGDKIQEVVKSGKGKVRFKLCYYEGERRHSKSLNFVIYIILCFVGQKCFVN